MDIPKTSILNSKAVVVTPIFTARGMDKQIHSTRVG